MAMLPTNVAAAQTGHIGHTNQVHKKLNNQWVDAVADYAAVGDGAADDTTALQNAINATPLHGTCLLARHKITASLSIPRAMRLLGAGQNAGIYATGTNYYIAAPSSLDGLILENLVIDGNYSTRTSGTAIALTACLDTVFDRCRFTNVPEHGISMTNTKRLWVDGCRFENLKTSGVFIGDGGAGTANQDIWITDNYFYNCQSGRVAGNASIQSAGGTPVGRTERLHIIGNRVKVPGLDGVGIGLDYAEYSEVIGNHVEGAIPWSTDGSGECIVATGRHITVSKNRAWNSGGSSGIMSFCRAGVLDGWGIIISENEVWDCKGQGIGVVWDVNNVTIRGMQVTGNICYDTGARASSEGQGYGFQAYITGGVTGSAWSASRLSGNNFSDNLNGGYTVAVSAGLSKFGNFTAAPATLDYTTPTF